MKEEFEGAVVSAPLSSATAASLLYTSPWTLAGTWENSAAYHVTNHGTVLSKFRAVHPVEKV